MKIEYSSRFIKEYKKCPPKLQQAFKKRLRIFVDDRSHPLLNNHKLTGKLKDYRSINITGDWRAVFQEINKANIIRFHEIGTHSNLYS